jgi:histidinol-phosphate phosphatase family protein
VSGARRAVFLDRDGTLTAECGHLASPERLRLLPGTGEALRRLARAGYALVVVTNQSVIGRGGATREAVDAVNERLRTLLRAEGIELDGLFLCPHAPDEGCPCRKPAPGLLHEARDALGLELGSSWLVGDTAKDVAAARAAGVEAWLVKTGWGLDEQGDALRAGLPWERVAEDLLDAAEKIVAA